MKNMTGGDHLAILIDADNVSSKIIAGLLTEVANYGIASVRRIYGDWTSPLMKSWRECLLEHSIVPIQQFAYTAGKNATDGAMIIDAMDLLYTGRFSSFCIVSSDSDFTRLAARIREQGISVYGFGNRHNTHKALIAACNKFIYLDALPVQAHEKDVVITANSHTTSGFSPDNPNEESGKLSVTPRPPPAGPRSSSQQPLASLLSHQHGDRIEPTRRPLDETMLSGLKVAVTRSSPYEENFVNLAEVGEYLVKISPDLNARNYGFSRLRDLAEASGVVEVKMKSRGSAPPIALVRLKD